MSEYQYKSHNVSVLLYHPVYPAKYRRVVFDQAVDTALKDVCLEIAQRYEIVFIEIGVSGDLKLLSGGQAQNVSGLLAVFFLTM